MGNYKKDGGKSITLDSAADDAIVAIDVWDGTEFDLNMYDTDDETFGKALLAMNNDIAGKTYLWIDGIEQLSRISTANKEILGFHLALKDDIDATGYENYEAIDGFKGAFDGRGFRIVNLQVGDESTPSLNAGVFSELKEDGEVRDLSIVASKFYGTNSAGAIAGVNEGGVISGVTTLGNYVEATGKDGADTGVQDVRGAAGGIVGINKGEIKGSDASDVVVAGGANVTAGGVAGVNAEDGLIGAKANGDGDFEIEEGKTAEDYLVTADSAVTANKQGIFSIGGAVGVNKGEANLLNSTGVTNGRSGTDAYNVDENVGGVVGLNDGNMTSLYNESIVMGKDNVGGVAGTNNGNMSNAVNATSVTADDKVDEDDNTAGNVGGLAGVNSGTIDSGRNAGVVTGGQNVGGLVGANKKENDEKPGILKNLSNALAAVINGKKFVGGIAGSNSGTITGASNLVNEGKISGETYVGGIVGANSGTINGNEGGTDNGVGLTNKATVSGNQFVGGIAGVNRGTIENVKSDTLVLDADGNNPTYFGGIAGQNNGTITNATNDSSVEADGAEYVGGIVGENTTIGKLIGEFVNNGSVLGRSSVGGLVGKNSNENLLVGNTDENGEITRLQVTNNGTVEATDGTAAGIVYEHDGNIMHADLTNAGEVKGNTGGTAGGGAEHGSGGLFGIVVAGSTISDAALINRGTVTVTEGGASATGVLDRRRHRHQPRHNHKLHAD